jgi:hypothetical protein
MYLVRRWHLFNLREHRDELERLLAIAAAGHQAPHPAHPQTTGQQLRGALPHPVRMVKKVARRRRGKR